MRALEILGEEWRYIALTDRVADVIGTEIATTYRGTARSLGRAPSPE
jgi:hypothetical protein